MLSSIIAPRALRAPIAALPAMARSPSTSSFSDSDFGSKSIWSTSTHMFPFGHLTRKTLEETRAHSRNSSFGSGFSSSPSSSRSSTPPLSQTSSFSFSHAEKLKQFKFGGVTEKVNPQEEVETKGIWAHLDNIIDTNDPIDDARFKGLINKAEEHKERNEDADDKWPRLFKLGCTLRPGRLIPAYIEELPVRNATRHIRDLWTGPSPAQQPQSWASAFHSRVEFAEPVTPEGFGSFMDFKLEDPLEDYKVPAFHLSSTFADFEQPPSYTSEMRFTAELCPELDEVYEPRVPTKNRYCAIGAHTMFE
ncbi:hypothetical protein BDQ17DRAFT_1359924 [Cyathus striatus]|nr:hypothetical protein BDQ17DRAFT_1359924 [Cyathus striatus]